LSESICHEDKIVSLHCRVVQAKKAKTEIRGDDLRFKIIRVKPQVDRSTKRTAAASLVGEETFARQRRGKAHASADTEGAGQMLGVLGVSATQRGGTGRICLKRPHESQPPHTDAVRPRVSTAQSTSSRATHSLQRSETTPYRLRPPNKPVEVPLRVYAQKEHGAANS